MHAEVGPREGHQRGGSQQRAAPARDEHRDPHRSGERGRRVRRRETTATAARARTARGPRSRGRSRRIARFTAVVEPERQRAPSPRRQATAGGAPGRRPHLPARARSTARRIRPCARRRRPAGRAPVCAAACAAAPARGGRGRPGSDRRLGGRRLEALEEGERVAQPPVEAKSRPPCALAQLARRDHVRVAEQLPDDEPSARDAARARPRAAPDPGRGSRRAP